MFAPTPRKYADELREYRALFDGRVVRLPGDPVGEITREGAYAVDEAIASSTVRRRCSRSYAVR